MTKRFKLGNYVKHPTRIIIDEVNGELNNSDVIDVLNEQQEEIKRLTKQKQYLIGHMSAWCPKRFQDEILKDMELI